jgi:WD40 repeat protein
MVAAGASDGSATLWRIEWPASGDGVASAVLAHSLQVRAVLMIAARANAVSSRIEHRLSQGHTQRITCGCFTTDGAQLVTGAADSEARVWATSDGTCLRVVGGHSKYITCMVRLPCK